MVFKKVAPPHNFLTTGAVYMYIYDGEMYIHTL